MKIEFENLGCIEQGSVELNDFTIFCGKNNSGKTYAIYCIYDVLSQSSPVKFSFVESIVKSLKQDGIYFLDIEEIFIKHKNEIIQGTEQAFKDFLPYLFNVGVHEFHNTKLQITISDKFLYKRIKEIKSTPNLRGNHPNLHLEVSDGKIQLTLNNSEISDYNLKLLISQNLADIFFSRLIQKCFLLPAERAGINLFFKELFSIRNLLLQESQSYKDINISNLLLKDVTSSAYPEPIKDYLQFINSIGKFKKLESEYSSYAEALENLLGGKYNVDDFGNISFSIADNKNKLALPLHFTSSTVKSLFGLVFYLKHSAKKGDYLMIDEPELNLHPDNQRQVARLLAQLVNAGLKVIVSTHSDYFIAELNNLMMLQKDFPEKVDLIEKYGYEQKDLLDESRVTAYLFKDKHIVEMEKDKTEGIITETFNIVTNALNSAANEIYFASQEADV